MSKIIATILALALAACANDGSPDPLPPCNELGCDGLSCDEHEPVCTCSFDDGTEFMYCDDTERK